MPSAPVYDYTGRNTIGAAWFAQAFSDGHGGSVLNAAAAQAVHKSVLEHCGAQAGVDEEARHGSAILEMAAGNECLPCPKQQRRLPQRQASGCCPDA